MCLLKLKTGSSCGSDRLSDDLTQWKLLTREWPSDPVSTLHCPDHCTTMPCQCKWQCRVCRLLWNTEPRSVEIYPGDDSVIHSIGHSGHHYVHCWFDNNTSQVRMKHWHVRCNTHLLFCDHFIHLSLDLFLHLIQTCILSEQTNTFISLAQSHFGLCHPLSDFYSHVVHFYHQRGSGWSTRFLGLLCRINARYLPDAAKHTGLCKKAELRVHNVNWYLVFAEAVV